MMWMEWSDMVVAVGTLLNCLKGLDELPSGMVFCLILAPRCEFLSLEPRSSVLPLVGVWAPY